LKSVYLNLGKLRRVTVFEFRMHDICGDDVVCFEIKVGTNAASLTNVIVAGPRE